MDEQNEYREKLGVFPFIIGSFSFIPLIGVLFGIIVIIWGLISKKNGSKKLVLVGLGGIAFSVILYSTLFYFGFVQRGGVYDKLRRNLSKTMINSLVQSIEYYKVQNGRYPESLEVLRKSLPENSFVSVYDPSIIKMSTDQKARFYYYKIINNDHYYLLGLGPDKQPFTNDDIVPDVNAGTKSKVGLLIKSKERE